MDSILTQQSQLYMSKHIEATLLEVVDKSHEGRTAARIPYHQQ